MAVNHALPAYFDNCFFAAVNMGPAWSTMERLNWQFHMYTGIHKWTLILTGLFILWYGIKYLIMFSMSFRRKPESLIILNKIPTFVGMTMPQNNYKYFKRPLVKPHIPLVIYAGACSAFVLYMSLGRHNGATLWYFFQLFSPFFLVASVWLFSRSTFWPIICVPFLILNLNVISADQNYKIFNKKMPGWREVSSAISQHQHILNSPLIAPLLIEQNKDVYDDGQAEYFLPGGERNYWLKGRFKEDDRVFIQQMLFFQDIRNKVENKEFDMILLQPSLLPLGVADDIKKYYKFEGQVMLYAVQDAGLMPSPCGCQSNVLIPAGH